MQWQTLTMINMLEYLSIHKGTHLGVQVSSINPLFEIVLRPSITFVKIGGIFIFYRIWSNSLKIELKFLPKLQILLKYDTKLHYLWSFINTPFLLFMCFFSLLQEKYNSHYSLSTNNELGVFYILSPLITIPTLLVRNSL